RTLRLQGQGRGQADSAGRRPVQLRGSNLRELRERTVGRNVHNRRTRTLLVGHVVEIADQDVTGLKITHAALDFHDAVRIDVPVRGDRRANYVDVIELLENGWATCRCHVAGF